MALGCVFVPRPLCGHTLVTVSRLNRYVHDFIVTDIHRQTSTLSPMARAEAIEAIQQAHAEGRAAGLREAVKIARTFNKGFDIEWWMSKTKKDISVAMCLELAEAIEQQASEGGEHGK